MIVCNKCCNLKCTDWEYGRHICRAPENMTIVHGRINGDYKVYDRKPEIINKDGDCPWFDPKWWMILKARLQGVMLE